MTSHFETSAALKDLLQRFDVLDTLAADLHAAYELLQRCLAAGNKVLTCGNGGSAADADHIAGELMKSFAYRRPISEADQGRLRSEFPDTADALIGSLETPLPAISLTGQIALLTAFANDVDYNYAFAQQVYGLGARGDVLIAISTSGTSASILNACRVARLRGVAVLGLTGRTGGKMGPLCDVVLRTPADETHLVQELHRPIYHALCLALEEHFFSTNGRRG